MPRRSSRATAYTVLHPFRQHLAGDDHGDGCTRCHLATYEPGEAYTGIAPDNPLERGFIVPANEGVSEVSDG